MSEENKKDFFDALDETIKSFEGSSGNGVFGKVTIGYGYGFYIRDVEQEDSWFEYKPNLDKDDPARLAAREAAKQFAAKYGIDKKLLTKFRIVVHKDKVFGRKPYQKDFWMTFPVFTSAYKDIIVPSMRKVGLAQLIQDGKTDFYVHLKYTVDPTGYKSFRTKRDENGDVILDEEGNEVKEARDNFIPYFNALYNSEEDCKKAAQEVFGDDESIVSESHSDDYPAGWNAETWELIIPDIKREKYEKGKSPSEIAKEYGIELKFVMKALQ